MFSFVSYINRNHKDTKHSWGRRLDTTLYIDQHVSQPVNLNFWKSRECGSFFFKIKSGDKNPENQENGLVASIYNAPPQKNKYFLWYVTNLLEFYWTRYKKVIILGDFNGKVAKVKFPLLHFGSSVFWVNHARFSSKSL